VNSAAEAGNAEMTLICLSQSGPQTCVSLLKVQPTKVRKEGTMNSTRARRRTARPLVVSGDVHLDMKIASWELELVAAELTFAQPSSTGITQGRRQPVDPVLSNTPPRDGSGFRAPV
jgi:hypothetical protein